MAKEETFYPSKLLAWVNSGTVKIGIAIGLIVLLGLAVLLASNSSKIAALKHLSTAGGLLNSIRTSDGKPLTARFSCSLQPITNQEPLQKISLAAERIDQALVLDPTNDFAYLQSGRAACLLGKYDQAVESYDLYIQLRPKSPLGHLEKALALEAACRAGEPQKTLEIQPKGICSTPGEQAVILAELKQAVLPQDLFEAGLQSAQLKRYQDALDWYQRALWMDSKRADFWLAAAQAYALLNEQQLAIRTYEKVWSLQPGMAAGEYANLLFSLELNARAEEILTTAVTGQSPGEDRLELYRMLGDLLRSQQKWEKAVQIYEAAVEEFPDKADLFLNLGWVYYESGSGVSKSQAIFEWVIQLEPNTGQGEFALGRLMAREKRFEKADQYFQAAIQKSPENDSWKSARANAATESGNYALARDIFTEILSRKPESPQVLFELARVYRRMEQKDLAVQTIESAIRVQKTPSSAFYMRAGEIYEWVGETEKAVQAYQQALEINPQNQSAQQALERLDQK